MKHFLLVFCSVVVISCQQVFAQQGPSMIVPAGGNSWVSTGRPERVTADGWRNWQNDNAVWSTYVKVQKPGTLRVNVLMNIPEGESELAFSIGTVTHVVKASGSGEQRYDAGTWDIAQPGYIKIEARGQKKTGQVFANVKEFQLSGTAIDSSTAFVKSNEGNYFYWGRRGPSVHINYESPVSENEIEWFYNEITVPPGSDALGSYFMADGFAEGYFGMQVNSATERRVIFSVWSPFKTDNPKEIPDDQKIILLKKGDGVDAGEFGNEGSGGHSHLVYNWKAGQTYKFLLHGTPAEKNYTNYTAWFYDNDKQKWIVIASFARPATSTYLKRLHSFLENFMPEAGNTTRKAFWHNQWVKPHGKEWMPLTKMFLTADATAMKGYRKDYDGGVENGMFYMRNGGFFNETATLRTPFTVPAPAKPPVVDLEGLGK